MSDQFLFSVGPQADHAVANSVLDARGGEAGEGAVSDLDAKYLNQVRYGNTFTVCTTGSVAASVNNQAATGLILSNPANSGKVLALLEVCIAPNTAAAAASQFILTGSADTSLAAPSLGTALTIQNAALSAAGNSVARASSQATLKGNTIFRVMGGGPVAASSINSQTIKDDIGGALVLAPNTHISVQALTTTIGMMASITWAEIPI